MSASSDNFVSKQQRFFINTFSLLGFLSVVTFGTLHILAGNYAVGIPECLGGVIFIANIVLLEFHHKLTLAKVVMLVTQWALLLYLLMTGGTEHTGIYWPFTFPLVAFFLMGRRAGWWWMTGFYISVITLLIVGISGRVELAYSVLEVRQMLVVLGIVTGLIYLYQQLIEKTAEKISTSENFSNSIINNLPHMVFVKDAKSLQFVQFNKAGEDLLGVKAADMIGKSDRDFFPKEQAEFFIAKDREVLSGRVILDIPEEPIETKTKGTRILHTKKIPIIDASGNPLYLLGISEDITERQEKERQFISRAKELERLNKLMVDRELQMVELKKELAAMKKR